jgi:hypothetical protein
LGAFLTGSLRYVSTRNLAGEIVMRAAAILLTLALGLPAPAQAQPFQDFFDYQEPRRPVGGDCGAIAAAVGPEATWRGEASGRRWEDFTENYYPFGVQGCFASEVECRIFLNQAATYAGRGPMSVLTCRRGVR